MAASGSLPTSSSATRSPVAYRTLLGGVDAPRAARRGKYSPSCLLWVAGVRGDAAGGRGAPQHPLRSRLGRVVPGAHPRRRADARSVDPRHAALARRPDTRAGRIEQSLRPRADCPTSTARSTGRASATGRSDGLRARVATLGYPTRRRRRACLRPARLGGDGHGARHSVRAGPHVPADRSVPPEQRRPSRARSRVHRVVDACRASACRWCWSRASSPPQRVEQARRARRRR